MHKELAERLRAWADKREAFFKRVTNQEPAVMLLREAADALDPRKTIDTDNIHGTFDTYETR